jgi:aminoglycoside phosphotransferase (APT) family kinase protein
VRARDAQHAVDAALAERLIHDQFPEWAHLPVRAVAEQGHDNRTFRVGEELSARFPVDAAHAGHVEIELAWLPRLAPRLPRPIPSPIARGAPTREYPFAWLVQRWLPGESALRAGVVDRARIARELAAFLNALRALDARGAPAPGAHNFHRGGSLAVYDAESRAALETLSDSVDAHAATALWEEALATRWERTPAWVHGDIAPANLLIRDGALCAVIDFGQLAAGDPACDLTIAWTWFDRASRAQFRAALALDASTWSRARGWALWKALRVVQRGDPAAARAQRVIADVLDEARARSVR